MKVRALIAKLKEANCELDVFVAPVVSSPDLGGGVSRIAGVFERHSIESISMVRDMEDLELTERIIISFDPTDSFLDANEFDN